MRKAHKSVSGLIFLLMFGGGCAAMNQAQQKTDTPLIGGGPGENLRRMIGLMQTSPDRRQGTAPNPADTRTPSSAEATASVSSPPVVSTPAIPVPPPATATIPATSPAATGESARVSGPPAPQPVPKVSVPVPATSQPPASRLETAASSPRMAHPAPSEPLLPRKGTFPADSSYRIGPEDVVSVAVWDNKELTMDVTVRPDGKISLPLIKDVQAAGLTPAELASAITGKLGVYIRDPQVTVIVAQIMAPKIFVIGNVLKPGNYAMKQEMTVLQALSLAGGFTTFASPRNIKLLRNNGGKQEIRRINYYKMVDESGVDNYILKPGDTIVVP
jgi:polysaccharide export outer membrane protein